jgi:tetratricopeptide (TPR) repeat protein
MGAASSTLRLTSLSAAEVGKLVSSLGEEYKPYEQLLLHNRVSGVALTTLNDDEMKLMIQSIGISNTTHQSILVAQFKKLKYGPLSISISLNRNDILHPDELDPSYFPLLGIKVSFLQEFINACPGRRPRIAHLTTDDICQTLVKPFTEPYKLSLCDLLNQAHHPGIGKATVFISHAWKYKFVDVVDALERKFSDALDTVVWFDVFSVNQHTTTEKDFSWWSGTFQEAIRQFGHTVMVLSPWHDPIPLTRAWCLWELYCTVITRCKFEVAFSEKEEEMFLQEVGHETLNSMKSKIDVERSECWSPDDRKQIFVALQRKTTFSELNKTVFNSLREWMTRNLSERNTNLPDDADMLFKKASLLMNHGDYSNAEELYRKCLAIRKTELGVNHPDTLATMNYLAALVLSNLGKYEEAKEINLACFEMRKEVLGPQHPDTLQSMHNLASDLSNLALLSKNVDNYDEAMIMFSECLAIKREVLGYRHPETLATMNSLGLVFNNQGKHAEAKIMYSEALEISKQVQGPRHPETLATMNNLAQVFRDLANFGEAKAMYTECMALCREVLGPKHPDTLMTMNNLANVLSDLGKHKEAKVMYSECLATRKKVLGPNHPDTLTTMHNLAVVLRILGKIEEAKVMCSECLTVKREVLGLKHPDTILTMNYLAPFLSDLRKYEEAKTMYSECLATKKEVLGHKHPSTLMTMDNLALVLSYQGKYEEAKTMLTECLMLHVEVFGDTHPCTLLIKNHLSALST